MSSREGGTVERTKSQKFSAKLTKRATVLSAVPSVIALLLLFQGFSAAQKFAANDPSRHVFIVVPLVLSLIIIGVTGITLVQNITKEVLLGADSVTFYDGKNKFVADYKRLAVSPPSNRVLFQVLLVSDGKNFGQVYDLFMPDFDTLCRGLDRRIRKAQAGMSTMAQQTYKL